MDGASRQLSDLLDTVRFNNATVPVVSNADAKYLNNGTGIKTSLIRQLSHPLLWEDSVKVMIGSGITIFLEVGPGKVLSGLIKRIDAAARVFNVEDMSSIEKTLSALNDKP
jgi:[acyl-carrier-protein] S-malonyltransferase